MPVTVEPIAVRESNAAAMVDMSVEKFRKLVQNGAFPGPVALLDGTERWLVDDLRAILTGKAAIPDQDFEL